MSSNGSKTQQPTLRVIPLGGLHEIGKNTCVFEFGDDLVLIDAGLAFPSDGMHGVNVVMPDTSFLRENQKRIRGMIVTHGHEDHIGGISHHLKHSISRSFTARVWPSPCLRERCRKPALPIARCCRR